MMRNNLYIVLGMLVIFACNVSLIAMHESVRTKIESLRLASVAEAGEHRRGCLACRIPWGCYDEVAIGRQFLNQVNELVLNAGDLVSDKEKLNHIYGDNFFHERKEIIKKMIREGEHPNNIAYQVKRTPFKEATLFKDKEFIQFLRQHGVNR
jgi:hypothetical protein